MIYAWTVYPSKSIHEHAMTATGMTDDLSKAWIAVETVLRISEEHAWGLMVTSDGLQQYFCHRAPNGRCIWDPPLPAQEDSPDAAPEATLPA